MYLSDMHTHSIASGHGTSCTISDMAKSASRKGLKLLGITDHGPATLAAGTASYFRSLNILDVNGKVDLEQELLEKLDYSIASIHAQNFHPASKEENTKAFLNVMKNPMVKILGHIDNTQYPVDYDAVVKAAGENGVLLEMNEASLAPYGYRGDTRSNCAEILRCCRKYLVPIVLSSDSHGAEHIGDFTYAADFVHQAMFPEGLILNNQIPKLKMILSMR